jgi:hypothetical protein
MNRTSFAIIAAGAALAIAACSSQPPPAPPAVTVSQSLITATPPPPVSTPVPVQRARQVPGAGRPDPFVALYGPAAAAPPTPSKPVAVSTFPSIPTLPGFGPGGQAHTIWDGVALTGVVRGQGYTAIVAVNDQSYIVRQGDSVGSLFRVAAIGPDFVTLVYTGSPAAERTFTLGG